MQKSNFSDFLNGKKLMFLDLTVTKKINQGRGVRGDGGSINCLSQNFYSGWLITANS